MAQATTTYAQAVKINRETAKNDPVFFMKNFCKIQHPKRGRIPFLLYPAQEDALTDFKNYQYNIVNKTRQIGLSTLIAGYILWMMTFKPDSNILVIATKLGTAKNLITKVRVMWKSLPAWLRVEEEEDNKLSLRLVNGSQVKAEAATPDSGRSEALSLLVIDEAAFVRYIDDIWTSAQSTLATGGDCIILSTPNGVGNFFHKTWIKALDGPINKTRKVADPVVQNGREYHTYQGIGANEFHPVFIHWSAHPDRDDTWRERQDSLLGPDKASQECDGSFLSSGNTVVNGTIIDRYLKTHKRAPIEQRHGTSLNIYKHAEDGARYLVCADVARGDGKDWSAFSVLDIDTLEQVADYNGKVDTKHYGDILITIATEYNDAILVVENANIGWAVLQRIIDRGYGNLFYSSADLQYVDLSKTVVMNKMMADEKKLIPGFSMTSKTRPLVVEKLDESFREESVIIRSERLLQQLFTWTWTVSGRADHLPGYNDDLITSLAIGLWVRDMFIKMQDFQQAAFRSKLSSMVNAREATNAARAVYSRRSMPNHAEQHFKVQMGPASMDLRELL